MFIKLNKILFKLIFLFLSVVLLFILGFKFFTLHEKTRLYTLLELRASEKKIFFDKVLELKSSSLKTFANDYTVYDGMVNFIIREDKKWAKENIEIGLETFKVNAIWIYKPDHSLIYFVNNLNSDVLKQVPIPKSSFKDIFEKDKLPVFYIETEAGLIEIVGATIHPTTDKERKTKTRGYFFVGRLLDSEYLKEISKLTESKAEILPYTSQKSLSAYDRNSKTIIVSKILQKWDGIPIALLHTESDTSIYQEYAHLFDITLHSFLLFALLILSSMAFFLVRWIVVPLDLISKSLAASDPLPLKDIKDNSSEFSIISKLIKRFFAQKEKLLREIKEHEGTNKAMLQSQTRLKALFELSPEAIYLTTVSGKVIDCNPAASEMSGYTKDELLQMTTCDLITEESVKQISAAINEKMLSNIYFAEHFCKRKGGVVFPVEMIARLIEIDKESFFIVIIRDMTEKRKMEKEILKSRQLESLGILAGGIAHDFNNILTGIMGNVSLAKMFTKPNDKIYERLTLAEKASLKAKDLTQQLLTFSKGGAPLKEVVSMKELLTESVKFLLSGKAIRCDYKLHEDLWMVETDIGQLNQVINNLIINALEAMPDSGKIDIAAENEEIIIENDLPLSPGRYVKVSIRDYGGGIEEEHLPRIFEPYYTTKQTGSGLGLAVVYSIIKRHKGHIIVESKQDKGTTFTFYLPATDKIEREIGIDEKKSRHAKGKILVMDDEDIIRDILVSSLSYLGFEVKCAKDGAETIELYKKAMITGKPFDALIMDLTIPGGLGGKETIKTLLEIDPNVKAIVASGYSNDPIMADFSSYGFKAAITKPFKLEALNDILSKMLYQ